jgi:NADP-dependent 3-hydroxy acid dehydrogenase YdfG
MKREHVMPLSGKVAWVTGGSGGIGLAAAIRLADMGATVMISSRTAESLEEAVQSPIMGGSLHALPLDVSDAGAVRQAVASIFALHGRVDILVNAAGINMPKRHWRDTDEATWKQIIDINLSGAMYCTMAVLPLMREQKDGLVINISSWAGRFGTHLTGPAYNASKHALAAVTHSLNMEECVNGIRGCTIFPAEVATPIMKKRPIPPSKEDMDRMLQPEDVAAVVGLVAELPARACINEIVISPTWNRIFMGADTPKR